MLIFNVLIFAIYIGLCFKNRSMKGRKNSSTKIESINQIFYKISEDIYNYISKYNFFDQGFGNKVHQRILNLNPGIKKEVIRKTYWVQKINKILMIILIFNILSTIVGIRREEKGVITDNLIKRPNYGEGQRSENMQVRLEPLDSTKNMEMVLENYDVDVSERIYDEALLLDMFNKGKEYIEHTIKGRNKEFNEINQDLYFTKEIPNTSIKVDWEVEDYHLIDSDGRVKNEEINKGGVETTVKAIMKYDDHMVEQVYRIRIIPQEGNEFKKVKKDLSLELSKKNKESRYEEYFKLPESLENYKIIWSRKRKNLALRIAILGIITSIVFWFYTDYRLEEKLKLRNKQMLMDYPNIVSKITLLVSAGMAIRQAWSKIIEDYETKKNKNKGEYRFIYEEMRVTYNEISMGISESTAYENFGRRVGILPYIKFSSSLCQNLMRGETELVKMLRAESMSAFNERKELAKVQAEEAATKILLPLLMVFSIVIAIILIPAFISFKI